MTAQQSQTGSEIQPISILNIPRALKSALTDAGYKTLGDVRQLSVNDISAEIGIPKHQAEDLRQQIESFQGSSQQQSNYIPPQSQIQASTAADLLSSAYLPHFSTSSTSIDHLIAHFQDPGRCHLPSKPTRKGKEKEDSAAITPGMAIEVSGPPGIGKTAVALGIALNARMTGINDAEDDERDPAGEVLIIDTEGGITAERVRTAAEAITRTCSTLSRDILHGIHFVRIPTQTQMMAFLLTLDEWLETHPKVNLIVIDTLSFHFRQPGLDMSTRRRMMELLWLPHRVKQKIGQATTLHHCAVIVCNQMATKLMTAENKPANFDTGDRAILMPQLGDAWTTGKTLRLCLFRGHPGDELRYVHASMSGSTRNLPWAAFDIDNDGLPCDIPEKIFERPKTPPPKDLISNTALLDF
ncbi:hypothetical protein L486_00396 [Kwoniella mangroviensis CBS 10435]|uniref:Uncharacterized protein n=1 Tax=Kwoniella mangroviensis CBS 10435 TaxID=1331196 RepID=A0A1B9IYZ8_9TREE|nr:hypothetical protein L486_00396 [Kwoniella mangroviensis CBS 10435]